jgi:hypothetical protein
LIPADSPRAQPGNDELSNPNGMKYGALECVLG